MKNKTINPTRSQFNILRQISNYIPAHEVSKIARETGAEEKSRTFKPWSHVVSLLYAQLTHSIGLNDLWIPFSSILDRYRPFAALLLRVAMGFPTPIANER